MHFKLRTANLLALVLLSFLQTQKGQARTLGLSLNLHQVESPVGLVQGYAGFVEHARLDTVRVYGFFDYWKHEEKSTHLRLQALTFGIETRLFFSSEQKRLTPYLGCKVGLEELSFQLNGKTYGRQHGLMLAAFAGSFLTIFPNTQTFVDIGWKPLLAQYHEETYRMGLAYDL